MNVARNISEAISDQVILQVERVHGLYLNLYQPVLQTITARLSASACGPNAAIGTSGPITHTVVADAEAFAKDREIGLDR